MKKNGQQRKAGNRYTLRNQLNQFRGGGNDDADSGSGSAASLGPTPPRQHRPENHSMSRVGDRARPGMEDSLKQQNRAYVKKSKLITVFFPKTYFTKWFIKKPSKSCLSDLDGETGVYVRACDAGKDYDKGLCTEFFDIQSEGVAMHSDIAHQVGGGNDIRKLYSASVKSVRPTLCGGKKAFKSDNAPKAFKLRRQEKAATTDADDADAEMDAVVQQSNPLAKLWGSNLLFQQGSGEKASQAELELESSVSVASAASTTETAAATQAQKKSRGKFGQEVALSHRVLAKCNQVVKKSRDRQTLMSLTIGAVAATLRTVNDRLEEDVIAIYSEAGVCEATTELCDNLFAAQRKLDFAHMLLEQLEPMKAASSLTGLTGTHGDKINGLELV